MQKEIRTSNGEKNAKIDTVGNVFAIKVTYMVKNE